MKAQVITASPFEFTDVLDMKIEQGINKHGQARIRGSIPEELEKQYVRMTLKETPVTISAADYKGNSRDLFSGILDDIQVSVVNGQMIMELTIMSYSRLLDLKPVTMLFQNTDLTYDELVEAVLSPFAGAAAIIKAGEGEAIEEMFVQYQETPWAFLKRIAGMKNNVLVHNDILGGIRLYFGFPNKKAAEIPPLDPITFTVHKNVGGYLFNTENQVPNIHENDLIYYIVKDREICEMGAPVTFQGRQLVIAAIESIWDGQELVHYYTLMSRNGVQAPQSRNYSLVGASLEGRVSQVSGSRVKMELPAAHQNDTSVTRWHHFSTVYSSPDGTGWYAMPEVGDQLRLYFPTEVDDMGYTISAVHLNVNGQPGGAAVSAPRTIESNKLISNNFGKEIELTPSSIRITSGGKSILIDDESGIYVTSDKDIEITGGNAVEITSLNGSVVMMGSDTVTVGQKDALVELNDENVIFKGAQTKAD